MDSVFPSSSMLEECLEREVVECGGIENMDKAPIPDDIKAKCIELDYSVEK
jgi:hypothetical protein